MRRLRRGITERSPISSSRSDASAARCVRTRSLFRGVLFSTSLSSPFFCRRSERRQSRRFRQVGCAGGRPLPFRAAPRGGSPFPVRGLRPATCCGAAVAVECRPAAWRPGSRPEAVRLPRARIASASADVCRDGRWPASRSLRSVGICLRSVGKPHGGRALFRLFS